MLHHHTEDPAWRAADVADREAEEVWQLTGNWDAYSATWDRIYKATLQEFAGEVPLDESAP